MNKHIRMDFATKFYPSWLEGKFITRDNETQKEWRDVYNKFRKHARENNGAETLKCLAKLMVFESGDKYDVCCGNGIFHQLRGLDTVMYPGYIDIFVYPAKFNNAETRIGLMHKYYGAFYYPDFWNGEFWDDNQWALDIDCSKLRSI